jgi:hypothetical protein
MDQKLLILAVAVLLSAALYLILVPIPGLTNAPTTTLENRSLVKLCSSDVSCGISNYTGYYECRGGSIYGEYVTRLCASSDIYGSQCVEFKSMEFIRNCIDDEECVTGKSDCYRKPSSTWPSTVPSSVKHYPPTIVPTTLSSGVTCVRNSSCGFDHYSKTYCSSSGHVMKDYIVYKCLNPGTYSSRCTSQKTTYLVDYCGSGQACVRGQCVEKKNLNWYCVRSDCCATDISLCGNYSIEFLPFPIRGLHDETFVLNPSQTI